MKLNTKVKMFQLENQNVVALKLITFMLKMEIKLKKSHLVLVG